MAKNLISKLNPKEFYIYDVSPKTTALFLKDHPNAKVSSSPKDLASKCNVIISMVPAPSHVKAVYLGENGVIHGTEYLTYGLRPGSLLIDSSTIGPQAAKDVAKGLEGHPCHFIDAPVSGGTPGAHAATLTFMV